MSTEKETRAEDVRTQGSLILQSHRDGDAHVVRLLGELDIAGAPNLEEELLRVEASDAPEIVVDLGELEFIDSTGIRLLLMSADRCADDERMTILRGPEQIHRVFEMTDLVSRLPFADG
ncbi:MAG: STAS domain-containing protein [Solirubrobacteraceae bacterium]